MCEYIDMLEARGEARGETRLATLIQALLKEKKYREVEVVSVTGRHVTNCINSTESEKMGECRASHPGCGNHKYNRLLSEETKNDSNF